MITDVEMSAMEMLHDEFRNRPGFEREHYALGAMRDMLAAMDSDKFYEFSEDEKKAFVKQFADAIVGERERIAEEQDLADCRWISVYKDTLCRHAENDNLVNIAVPADWLYDALAAEGVDDIEAWFDEYTADGTVDIAHKAVSEGVIRGCDDEYAMAVINFEKEHADLAERAEAVQEWLLDFGEDIPDGLGFEHEGMWINNPFYDESLRFDVEPFIYYGVENMTAYLEKAEGIMSKTYEAKIDEAVRELHHVGEDKKIVLYADYRDNSQFLWKTLLDNAKSPELESIVRDSIWESYADAISEYEDAILERAGVAGEEYEQDALEYLRDNYTFEPPYDHFMKDEMKVNILLATPEERNNEYTCIAYQNYAMVDPERLTDPASSLAADTMIVRLLEQQGHTLEELQTTMKEFREYFYDKDGFVKDIYAADGRELSYEEKHAEFDKTHNAFLTSICQELDNQTYEMGCLTVLAKVSVEDFIKMQTPGTEVVMPKDAMLGIYNPWNGSGSVLEIELEKDFAFTTDTVRNMQIEGVKPAYEHTVDDAFGLVGTCWKEPVSIAVPEKKRALDDVIRSCEETSKKTDDGQGKNHCEKDR